MEKNGFLGNFKIQPIGSRKNIPIPTSLPLKPTVGFFCGETPTFEKRSLFFQETIIFLKKIIDVDVLMIGRNLDHISELGTYESRAAQPDDYSRIDCLFTSSISKAVPLSVYEACSIGKPIVSTPRQFPVDDWPNIFFANTVEGLASHMTHILNNRVLFFKNFSKNKFQPYVLEDYINLNMTL